jgi:hypothetical protein
MLAIVPLHVCRCNHAAHFFCGISCTQGALGVRQCSVKPMLSVVCGLPLQPKALATPNPAVPAKVQPARASIPCCSTSICTGPGVSTGCAGWLSPDSSVVGTQAGSDAQACASMHGRVSATFATKAQLPLQEAAPRHRSVGVRTFPERRNAREPVGTTRSRRGRFVACDAFGPMLARKAHHEPPTRQPGGCFCDVAACDGRRRR